VRSQIFQLERVATPEDLWFIAVREARGGFPLGLARAVLAWRQADRRWVPAVRPVEHHAGEWSDLELSIAGALIVFEAKRGWLLPIHWLSSRTTHRACDRAVAARSRLGQRRKSSATISQWPALTGFWAFCRRFAEIVGYTSLRFPWPERVSRSVGWRLWLDAQQVRRCELGRCIDSRGGGR
jgi:hypothetical protein